MAGALEGAVQYLIDHPLGEATQYLTDHPIADAVRYIAGDTQQVASITSADVTNGNATTLYSNPSQKYPTTGTETGLDISQLLIYNDPRAALQALNDLGLSNLV